MTKKVFSKESLVDLAYGHTVNGFGVIVNEVVDTSRWSTIYEMIFSYGGEYFRTSYSVAATECQDERPYEYEGDNIECTQVWPKEVMVTKYVEDINE